MRRFFTRTQTTPATRHVYDGRARSTFARQLINKLFSNQTLSKYTDGSKRIIDDQNLGNTIFADRHLGPYFIPGELPPSDYLPAISLQYFGYLLGITYWEMRRDVMAPVYQKHGDHHSTAYYLIKVEKDAALRSQMIAIAADGNHFMHETTRHEDSHSQYSEIIFDILKIVISSTTFFVYERQKRALLFFWNEIVGTTGTADGKMYPPERPTEGEYIIQHERLQAATPYLQLLNFKQKYGVVVLQDQALIYTAFDKWIESQTNKKIEEFRMPTPDETYEILNREYQIRRAVFFAPLFTLYPDLPPTSLAHSFRTNPHWQKIVLTDPHNCFFNFTPPPPGMLPQIRSLMREFAVGILLSTNLQEYNRERLKIAREQVINPLIIEPLSPYDSDITFFASGIPLPLDPPEDVPLPSTPRSRG